MTINLILVLFETQILLLDYVFSLVFYLGMKAFSFPFFLSTSPLFFYTDIFHNEFSFVTVVTLELIPVLRLPLKMSFLIHHKKATFDLNIINNQRYYKLGSLDFLPLRSLRFFIAAGKSNYTWWALYFPLTVAWKAVNSRRTFAGDSGKTAEKNLKI